MLKAAKSGVNPLPAFCRVAELVSFASACGDEFYRTRQIFYSIFFMLTVLNIGISVFAAHIIRPHSIAGTYAIEKAVPEMDEDGATGNISCIAKDKDGKKVVLTTDGTLKSYKSIKLTYTRTFLDAWNKDQYGNNWEKAKNY